MISDLSTAVIPSVDPATAGIDERRIDRLASLIESHIERGWYPGAAIAMARNSQLILHREFGHARIEPEFGAAQQATADTRWLLYSQTKPIFTSVVWMLIEDGLLRFHDRIAEYVPEFARHGKEDITLAQVLAHQGGFPNATVGAEAWEDHELMRELVCDFRLDWAPGTKLEYHGASAHWVQAMLIEAVTDQTVEIVCDRGYLRHQRKWRKKVARNAGCRVVQVESDVVVPLEVVSHKAEYAARTIRPKIHKHLGNYLVEFKPTKIKKSSLQLRIKGIDLSKIDAVLKKMSLDRSVGPVSQFFEGGTAQARQIFKDFLRHRFAHLQEL